MDEIKLSQPDETRPSSNSLDQPAEENIPFGSTQPSDETCFSNAAVPLENISIVRLQLSDISSRYRSINMVMSFAITSLVCLIMLIVHQGWLFSPPTGFVEPGPWIISAVALLGVVNISYHFFADPKIKYALREQDLHFQSGLFFRRLVSQPILRIQHIELKRGPIERKANLATLQVFSAGGMSHTFEIPGLPYEKAVSLRQFIIDHRDLSIDE
ncbi:PH domain-containing protein [Ningiella sp. W23]|uniref:PH domain-containing protein n=1 Tax=Ningiella sp. W23 TaxID=3023715 RepID=UPI0037576FF2